MSEITFDNYGKRAREVKEATLVSGRYAVQQKAERLIAADVGAKLRLTNEDTLLEIGCGIGTLLIPLSFAVKSASGIDHPWCIERLQQRCRLDNVQLIPGNFMDINLSDHAFDKILVYSVLHCLSHDQLLPFIDKCATLLTEGGMLMLGDIPNISLKKRFLESCRGKRFHDEWLRDCQTCPNNDVQAEEYSQDDDCVHFDDALVVEILGRMRRAGFSAYVLPQRAELPFCHTREDIIIEKP